MILQENVRYRLDVMDDDGQTVCESHYMTLKRIIVGGICNIHFDQIYPDPENIFTLPWNHKDLIQNIENGSWRITEPYEIKLEEELFSI